MEICQLAAKASTTAKDRYATSEQFRTLFAEDMDRMYVLAFLLTASHEKAEQCLLGALKDCTHGVPVFHQWAPTWARRAVVQNAIRLMDPRPSVGSVVDKSLAMGLSAEDPCLSYLSGSSSLSAAPVGSEDAPSWSVGWEAPFEGTLALGDFERVVFVLTVLERHTDQDCAALLRTSRQEVREGRIRAFRQLPYPEPYPKWRSQLSSEWTSASRATNESPVAVR